MEAWPSYVHERFVAIQDALDTGDFVVGDMNVWAVVRLQILMDIGKKGARLYRELFDIPAHVATLHRMSPCNAAAPSRALHVRECQGGALFERVGATCERIRDSLLFLEVPGDYTQEMDGRAVDVFCDPFFSIFSTTEKAIKLCRFEKAVPNLDYFHEPTWFLASGQAEAIPSAAQRRLFELTAQANRRLDAAGLGLRIDFAAVLASTRQMLGCHAFALSLFSRCRPRAVLYSNFANLEKMGFTLAAKRLGIPTADIMHGFVEYRSITLDHPALPPEVLSPLPDAIWCWGRVSRDALLARKKERHQAWRRAFVAGHPWKSMYRDFSGDDTCLADLRRSIPTGKRVALYCHEPSVHNAPFEDYLPTDILGAMTGGDDVFWLVRMHPRSGHLRERMREFMAARGVRLFEADLASRCVLDDLFSLADVVVTKFSVVAMEAAACGVAVITTHPAGRDIFADHIATGHVRFCDGPGEILEAIRTAKPPREPLDYVARDDTGHSLAWEALRKTLTLSGASDHETS